MERDKRITEQECEELDLALKHGEAPDLQA
jgi:hypothetical protein